MNPWWKLRLAVKWVTRKLRLAGLVSLIEYCNDCGVKQPIVWYAPDDLWLAVTGDVGGVLCPRCFDRRAVRALGSGIVRWTPEFEPSEQARRLAWRTAGIWRPSSWTSPRRAGPTRKGTR